MDAGIRKGDTVKDHKGSYYKVCEVTKNGEVKMRAKGVVVSSTIQNVKRVA
jgi:hypothetical protein